MTAIPFPLTSAPGQRAHESAGRLVNAYAEPLQAGARSQTVWRRAPGLRTFSVTGKSGFRGAILVANTIYAAFENVACRFALDGTMTEIGELPGTKGVFWAANNKSPVPDIVAVDVDNGAFVVTDSSVSSYPDPDLPASNSVTFKDGYLFFTTGDGRCFASDINDTGIDALNVASAEAKRDGLLRAVAFDSLYLCGQKSIEVWQDTGNPVGFPFSRVNVIQKGLLSPYAISGFEDGFGKGIVLLGDDGVVYALNGYSATKISTADVDRAVQSFREAGGDETTIEMFPYVAEGHACVAMRCSAFTWVLDLDTVKWHERQSYELSYWRARGAISAFGRWICGDSENGNLGEITKAVANEYGQPIAATVESAPVTAFPANLAVSRVTIDIAQGVGVATGANPNQTDPSVEISWNDDGYRWSNPIVRKLGSESQSRPNPVRVFRTGRTKNAGRRWRVRVTDEVDFVLTGGDMQGEQRAA